MPEKSVTNAGSGSSSGGSGGLTGSGGLGGLGFPPFSLSPFGSLSSMDHRSMGGTTTWESHSAVAAAAAARFHAIQHG